MSDGDHPAKRVLDVSHPHERLFQQCVARDMAEHGFSRRSYDDWWLADEARVAMLDEELELAEMVLVASSYAKRSLLDAGTPAEKVFTVPYGIPTPESGHVEDGSPTGRLSLVFVGAISERKGISLLLRAMQELERRGAPCDLTIVGSRAAEVDLSLPGNAKYAGAVSREELRATIARAHYLVLPSICEGFGVVLIEALALGTGIIATETSAAPDLAAAHPEAPIKVISVAERDRLAELFLELRDDVAADGLDREAAIRASRFYTLDAYGERLNSTFR